MVIAKELRRRKLQIQNSIIEQIFRFRYLRVKMTSLRGLNEEIQLQNTKTLQIAGCLGDIIFRNKYVRKKAKS